MLYQDPGYLATNTMLEALKGGSNLVFIHEGNLESLDSLGLHAGVKGKLKLMVDASHAVLFNDEPFEGMVGYVGLELDEKGNLIGWAGDGVIDAGTGAFRKTLQDVPGPLRGGDTRKPKGRDETGNGTSGLGEAWDTALPLLGRLGDYISMGREAARALPEVGVPVGSALGAIAGAVLTGLGLGQALGGLSHPLREPLESMGYPSAIVSILTGVAGVTAGLGGVASPWPLLLGGISMLLKHTLECFGP